MKKRAIALAVACLLALGLLLGQRYAQHLAWLEEWQSAAHQCREIGAALMKESGLVFEGEPAETDYEERDGLASYRVTAGERAISVVLELEGRELVFLQVRGPMDERQRLAGFDAMLHYAGVSSVRYPGYEADAAGEHTQDLYQLALEDKLTRNGYQFTVQVDESNRTEVRCIQQDAGL